MAGYLKFTLLLTALCSVSVAVQAQVTFVIKKLPAHTPANAVLYIAGNFNDWNPNHDNFRLTQQTDGTYSITLVAFPTTLEYKFTRGTWESVEGDVLGNKIANRTLLVPQTGPVTVSVEIANWEDDKLNHHYKIRVHSIPATTPPDASLYVSGNFNNWNDRDPDFKLQKQPDGTYSVTLPATLDTIYYKFTRGGWQSAECQANGKPLRNRSLIRTSQTPFALNAEIAGWEDIPSNLSQWYTILLLVSAMQALLLMLAFSGTARQNTSATQVLVCLLASAALSLLGQVSTYNRIVFNWQPKIILLSDYFYFIYAPLFFLYLRRFYQVPAFFTIRRWWLFVPLMAQILIHFPLFFMPKEAFVAQMIDQTFTAMFAWTGSIALLYNIGFWIISFRLLYTQMADLTRSNRLSGEKKYLLTLLVHHGICLLIWFFSYAAYGLSFVFVYDPIQIHEACLNTAWLIFAMLPCIFVYFAISQPDLFKVAEKPTEEKTKLPIVLKEPILPSMKEALATLMQKDKPYLNPKLTLQDLADKMNTRIHTVSRLINEEYEKSFFDFINEYRIAEFKQLVNKEQYKHYTFLAVALEVGFSSKTTFNRAFKKSTGKTPREYFNLEQNAELQE